MKAFDSIFYVPKHEKRTEKSLTRNVPIILISVLLFCACIIGTALAFLSDTASIFTTGIEFAFSEQNANMEAKFPNTNQYLYRVGNANNVALGSLFAEEDESASIDSTKVSLECETMHGNAEATYTPNATDWEKGNLKFSGTGVVKLSVKQGNSKPVELLLEVVDGKNVTAYTDMTGGSNCILLNDISSPNGFSIGANKTLFGNGFSIADERTDDKTATQSGFISLNNSSIDNVKIIGKEYTERVLFISGAPKFTSPAILASGNSNIYNSYVSGCRCPVNVREGNFYMKETTLDGGAVANMIISSGNVTLENCVTATSTKGLKGLGVMVQDRNVKLQLIDGFKQYNWLQQSELPTSPFNFQSVLAEAYKNPDFAYTGAGKTYVNMGILFFNEGVQFNEDVAKNAMNDATGNTYGYFEKTVSGITATCYMPKSSMADADSLKAPEYKTVGQNPISPLYNFDFMTKNYIDKVDDSNKYCYYDNNSGRVKISFDSADNQFPWDPMIMSVDKCGKNLKYTVKMNGVDYTDKLINFNESGEYTITYTYTDGENYNKDGDPYDVTYEKHVQINVIKVDPEITVHHPDFTYVGAWANKSAKVVANNKNYIMPDVGGTSKDIGSTVVDGKTIYYPIVFVEGCDKTNSVISKNISYYAPAFYAINITDYNQDSGAVQYTYNKDSTQWPHGKASNQGPDQAVFRHLEGSMPWESSGTSGRIYAKHADKGLCYYTQNLDWSKAERGTQDRLVEFQYVSTDGEAYYYYIMYDYQPSSEVSTGGSACVTPDTIITLADGSHVEIQDLKGDEELLVWNHITGKFDTAPVAFIVNNDETERAYEVIHLYFDDGNDIKIIERHVFFDVGLNKYVPIGDDAEAYIGHRFITTADGLLQTAKLIRVERETCVTKAYEVASYKHLTSFTNNILSAAAYDDKLLNIFDIDTETMAYDLKKRQDDIKTYGLYTYSDFEGLIPEAAFEMYNGAYLKVAIGKGYITWQDILELIDMYYNDGVKPIQ